MIGPPTSHFILLYQWERKNISVFCTGFCYILSSTREQLWLKIRNIEERKVHTSCCAPYIPIKAEGGWVILSPKLWIKAKWIGIWFVRQQQINHIDNTAAAYNLHLRWREVKKCENLCEHQYICLTRTTYKYGAEIAISLGGTQQTTKYNEIIQVNHENRLSNKFPSLWVLVITK